MILNIDVTNILSLPITNTTAGITAGSSVSTNVVNTSGFSGNDYVVVGNLGDESSELQLVSSITDADTLVLATASLNHGSGTPIQKVTSNQIVLERSSDNSSWSTIATITIKGDQRVIDYNDTTGVSTDYYRFSFYNSTTAVPSPTSNSFSASSAPSAIDIIITDVISELGTDYDDVITKKVIFNALADTDLKVAREIVKTNKEFYKVSSFSINLVANTTEYALPAALVSLTRVMVGYDSATNQVKSVEVPLEYGATNADLNNVFHSSYRKESDGLTYLVLKRTPTQNVTDGITISYVTKPSRIISTTSPLLTPQPNLYVDLLKSGIKEIIYRDYKDNIQKSQLFGAEFRIQLRDLLAITNSFDYSEGAVIISESLAYAFDTP